MTNRSAPNIWQLQAQKNIPGIISALETRDPSIRRRAIGALKALDATEAVPQLHALKDREFNPEIRELIESALQHLTRHASKTEKTQEDHRRELLEQLSGTDVEKAMAAIPELIQISDRTVIENLMAVFRTESNPPKLRLAAAEALLKLESAPATVSLLGALRKSDWQVRRNAAAVLGQLEADWCEEPLIEVMNNDANPNVRKTAAAALRRINTPTAVEAVKKSEFGTPMAAATPAIPTPASPEPAPPTAPVAVPPPPTPAPSPMGTGMLNPANLPQTGSLAKTGALNPDVLDNLKPTSPDWEALPQPAWIRKKRPTLPPKENK